MDSLPKYRKKEKKGKKTLLCLLFAQSRLARALRPHTALGALQLRQHLWRIAREIRLDDDIGFGVLFRHGDRFPAKDRDPRYAGCVEHVVQDGGADEARGSGENEMHCGRKGGLGR